ncbi:hypothetical protein [Paenibacillus validus]|uniref:hypothetical protein n=1 Tax=Paenibacillus validus TaxID=44253 RepID=UPI003D2C975D
MDLFEKRNRLEVLQTKLDSNAELNTPSGYKYMLCLVQRVLLEKQIEKKKGAPPRAHHQKT